MVKCSECGFLANRNTHSRQLEEVEPKTRDFGYVNTGVCEAPICIIQANDLWAESGIGWGTICYGNVETVKSAIQKERECKEFIKWQQGFTPKEHKEMMDREAMLKWQAEREEADRKWRESQEKRHSKEEWKRYIFMAVITIVAVILGVILGHFI